MRGEKRKKFSTAVESVLCKLLSRNLQVDKERQLNYQASAGRTHTNTKDPLFPQLELLSQKRISKAVESSQTS